MLSLAAPKNETPNKELNPLVKSRPFPSEKVVPVSKRRLSVQISSFAVDGMACRFEVTITVRNFMDISAKEIWLFPECQKASQREFFSPSLFMRSVRKPRMAPYHQQIDSENQQVTGALFHFFEEDNDQNAKTNE